MKVCFNSLFIIIFSFALYTCERDNPQPAPKITTVFHDDFSDNKYNWEQLNSDTAYVSIQNDSLLITHKLANLIFSTYHEIQIDTSKNFSIKSSMVWKSGVTNYGYGLAWGHKDVNNKYYFVVTSTGAYSIGFTKNGINTIIVPWTYFSGINPMSNLLEIRKEGTKVTFNINNQKAYSTTFRPIFGNGIGFRVSDKMGVGIDYLDVTQW